MIKSWFITTEKEELMAAFVAIDLRSRILRLNCRGKVVKLLFEKKEQYQQAVNGVVVPVLAKGSSRSVPCTVQFKITGGASPKVLREASRAKASRVQNEKAAKKRWDNE